MTARVCSRCLRDVIMLYRLADETGICLACIFAAREAAVLATIMARLERYLKPKSEN